MTGTGIAPSRPSAPATVGRGIWKPLQASEAGLTILHAPYSSPDFRQLCSYSDSVSERTVDDAAALLARLPTAQEERDRGQQIADAMGYVSDRKAIVGMVAMLIDAFPSGRPANPEAYMDAIVHDLLSLRFAPAVVALACQTVRRTSKFLPSVSEIIEAANEANEQFEGSRRFATNCAERIERATRNVAAVRQRVCRDTGVSAEDFSGLDRRHPEPRT